MPFFYILREHHADAFHAHTGAGVALHLHVGGARRVVAHQDGREDGGLARLFLEFRHAGAEFFFSGLGECLAVSRYALVWCLSSSSFTSS